MSSHPLRSETSSPLRSEKFHFSRLAQDDFLPTGLEELDALLHGGIPRGKLIEICGAHSSGRTSLAFSLMHKATEEEELVAYVDGFDTFDPESAQKAGVRLDSLLWVRCPGGDTENHAVDRALQAADILAQAGGFGIVLLDLDPVSLQSDQGRIRIPPHAWFRLQRAVKGSPTILLVISRQRLSGSAAALVLSLEQNGSHWNSRNSGLQYHFSEPFPTLPGGRLENRLGGVESSARLLRGQVHGSVPVYCRF